MKPYLDIYPSSDAGEIDEGFSTGFSLDFMGGNNSYIARNHRSARERPEEVNAKISARLNKGIVAGPYDSPPFTHFRSSAIGLVEKSIPNTWRFIHDLSTYPKEDSVNQSINPDSCSVQYTTLDQVVAKLADCGKGANMFKADIQSAFDLLPIRPQEYNLLGFSHQGKFYVNRVMAMGAACSCQKFEKLSTFLQWVIEHKSGYDSLAHYCDDFLGWGPLGTSQAEDLLALFVDTCQEFGVPIAHDKTVPPTTCLVFLGLTLDTERQEVRVPPDKLESTLALIDNALNRPSSKITLSELQSLIGKLQFLCRAIAPGRAFVRRLTYLTRNVVNPRYYIRLTVGAKRDLLLWKTFLSEYNGVSMFRDMVWADTDSLDIFTDASFSAMGIYFMGHWVSQAWPHGFISQDTSIAFLEIFPIAVLLVIWGKDIANRSIVFHVDNMSVVQCINRLSSACPMIMRVIRFIVLKALHYNIALKARHVPGKVNIADSLSRLDLKTFHKQAPHADVAPTTVPPSVWDI